MIMIDRSRRLAEPLRWGRREKTAVAVLLGCLALALVALGAFALTGGSPVRKDCVTVTFASTLGSTIPAPPISIQPDHLHVGQPVPPQTPHETSGSIEGSVNGK